MALGYGSRGEILGAINKILKKKKTILQKKYFENLMTSHLPEPDLSHKNIWRKEIVKFFTMADSLF